MSKRAVNAGIAIVFASLLAVALAGLLAGQTKSEDGPALAMPTWGGVVTSSNGPEAGVWGDRRNH